MQRLAVMLATVAAVAAALTLPALAGAAPLARAADPSPVDKAVAACQAKGLAGGSA